MRYALLLFLDPEAAPAATPDQALAELHAYRALTDRLAADGVLRSGEALLPAEHATSVRLVDGQPLKARGPALRGDVGLTGFYVVDASDEEQALTLAAQMPVATRGVVEVRPVMDWPPAGEPPVRQGASGT